MKIKFLSLHIKTNLCVDIDADICIYEYKTLTKFHS